MLVYWGEKITKFFSHPVFGSILWTVKKGFMCAVINRDSAQIEVRPTNLAFYRTLLGF